MAILSVLVSTLMVDTVAVTFQNKKKHYMLRYGSRSYNLSVLKKGIQCIFGTVRNARVRYGTIGYGTVRYCTVRYGTLRYGTKGYGTVR